MAGHRSVALGSMFFLDGAGVSARNCSTVQHQALSMVFSTGCKKVIQCLKVDVGVDQNPIPAVNRQTYHKASSSWLKSVALT